MCIYIQFILCVCIYNVCIVWLCAHCQCICKYHQCLLSDAYNHAVLYPPGGHGSTSHSMGSTGLYNGIYHQQYDIWMCLRMGIVSHIMDGSKGFSINFQTRFFWGVIFSTPPSKLPGKEGKVWKRLSCVSARAALDSSWPKLAACSWTKWTPRPPLPKKFIYRAGISGYIGYIMMYRDISILGGVKRNQQTRGRRGAPRTGLAPCAKLERIHKWLVVVEYWTRLQAIVQAEYWVTHSLGTLNVESTTSSGTFS